MFVERLFRRANVHDCVPAGMTRFDDGLGMGTVLLGDPIHESMRRAAREFRVSGTPPSIDGGGGEDP